MLDTALCHIPVYFCFACAALMARSLLAMPLASNLKCMNLQKDLAKGHQFRCIMPQCIDSDAAPTAVIKQCGCTQCAPTQGIETAHPVARRKHLLSYLVSDAEHPPLRLPWSPLRFMQILRNKIKECYATHGVNYVTECQEIVKKYNDAQRVRIQFAFRLSAAMTQLVFIAP